MEYIVIMATALYDRCYFESSVFPLADIPCADPIEAVLDEADKCGIKVFLGNGFYGDWTKPGVNITSGEVIDRSFKAMDELTENTRGTKASTAGISRTRPALFCAFRGIS